MGNRNGMSDFDFVGSVPVYTNDCLSTGYGSVTQEYEYDSLYRLVNAKGDYKHSRFKDGYVANQSKYEQSFFYDSIGNIMGKVSQGDEVQNTKTDGLNYDFSYEYDQDYAHRLERVGDSYFQYDANGNITAISDTSFDPQYDFAAHRISSTEWYYNYDITDPSSVPEKEREFNYQRSLQYDDRGMMSYSSGSSEPRVKYLYDADGKRTLKYNSTDDIEHLTFNDFYSVLISRRNRHMGGQIQKSVVLGDLRLVTRIDQIDVSTREWKDERTFYYLSDHLGSATLITDYKGDIFRSTEYTPYGERWAERMTGYFGDWGIPYRFTGKPLDDETGYYYFGTRYYDPRLLVWTASDPAMAGYFDDASKGEGGVYNFANLNSYHYAGNNPVKYVDPTGESAISIVFGIIGADAVVPEPTDFIPHKWIGYGIVIVGAVVADVGIGIYKAVSSNDSSSDSSVSDSSGGSIMPEPPDPNKKDNDSDSNLNSEKSPYENIKDSKSVGEGKKFAQAQKQKIIEANKSRNGGVVKSDLSGKELSKPVKSSSRVTLSQDEWQIDHIKLRSKGGSNSYSNAQVLSRQENRLKWDNYEVVCGLDV